MECDQACPAHLQRDTGSGRPVHSPSLSQCGGLISQCLSLWRWDHELTGQNLDTAGTQQERPALPWAASVHPHFHAHQLPGSSPGSAASWVALGRLLTFLSLPFLACTYSVTILGRCTVCLAHTKLSMSLSSSYCHCYSPAWQSRESLGWGRSKGKGSELSPGRAWTPVSAVLSQSRTESRVKALASGAWAELEPDWGVGWERREVLRVSGSFPTGPSHIP